MREFGSLAELADHLTQATVAELESTKKGLEAAASLLQREAKAEFGTYQEAAGPFPAWAKLAESTKTDRVAHGYSADDPLLRDGTLRDSIVKEVEPTEAIVGSTDPVMLYQELGTSRMPPRPVLGIALYRNLDNIRALVAEAAVAGLIGEEKMDASRGYEA